MSGSAALPIFLLAVACAALPVARAADVERGQQFYVICGACHGAAAQGERGLDTPALAGQQPAYLLRQLRNFKAHTRGDQDDGQARQMQQILDTFPNERDWQDIVAFIQTLPPPPSPPASTRADSERGAKVYAMCASCHGVHGEGNESLEAPSLRWLPDWYIASELRKFRAGRRGSAATDAPGKRMQAVATTLSSDDDVLAVAAFIGGHSPQ